jgi:predicted RNA-binding protein with PIN domain
MTLHFFLDGYNIVKAETGGFSGCGSLEEQRNGLLRFLQNGRPQGSPRNRVTVVFDGPADVPAIGASPYERLAGNIDLVFSEGETADEKIVRLVQDCRHDDEVVVVSNDRGLRRVLGGSGAKFLAVEEFLARARRPAASSGGSVEKKLDSGAVDDITQELKKRWLK